MVYVQEEIKQKTDDEAGASHRFKEARQDESEILVLKSLPIKEGLVPNVTGMGAKDAVYILESKGLKVTVNGLGRVTSQSVAPGTKITKGRTIALTLK